MRDVSAERHITIQSSNVDLGDAFRSHARQLIERAASKYFHGWVTAAVHVTREGINYRCTVNIQPTGLHKLMTGEFQHKDCYGAFNNALSKVEKQLRRAKREVREDKPVRTDKDMILQDGLRRNVEMVTEIEPDEMVHVLQTGRNRMDEKPWQMPEAAE